MQNKRGKYGLIFAKCTQSPSGDADWRRNYAPSFIGRHTRVRVPSSGHWRNPAEPGFPTRSVRGVCGAEVGPGTGKIGFSGLHICTKISVDSKSK